MSETRETAKVRDSSRGEFKEKTILVVKTVLARSTETGVSQNGDTLIFGLALKYTGEMGIPEEEILSDERIAPLYAQVKKAAEASGQNLK